MKLVCLILLCHDEQLILIGDESVHYLIRMVADPHIVYHVWLLYVNNHYVVRSNAFKANEWPLETKAGKHWFLLRFYNNRIEIHRIFTHMF